LFSADYRREFRELFEERICPRDPTIYVNITSRLTPADAPAGGENWFVLVNAPYLAGQDWRQETVRVRRRVLEVLERSLGRPVAPRIAVERVITPEDIARDTGCSRGSLYGISSNSPLAAFLRHPNRSRRVRGLYFCGGTAHPGGGMPLAVLSGKIAAELVVKHER
jgi:phytoene dehydrogenase-like protein